MSPTRESFTMSKFATLASVGFLAFNCLIGPCTVRAWLDCTLPPPLALENDLAMQQIANYEAGTYTMKLTYTGGRAWIGIGINSEGKNKMIPANAVIGRAYSDGTTSVLKYSMTTDAQDGSGVTPLAASSQTLTDVSFVQTDSTTELTFTQPLNEPEQVVADDSTWIYGVGLDDNQWEGKHKIHGSFLLPLSSCVNVPDTPSPTTEIVTDPPTQAPVIREPTSSPRPTSSFEPTNTPTQTASPTTAPVLSSAGNNASGLNGGSGLNGSNSLVFLDTTHPFRAAWAAHGILLFLAWGIAAPLGIGVSILRKPLIEKLRLPKGLWYKLHLYLNLCTVVLTVLGFMIAFIATQREIGGKHLYDTHHKAGLVIFLFVLVQALLGYYRPELPPTPPSSPPPTNGGADEENGNKAEVVEDNGDGLEIHLANTGSTDSPSDDGTEGSAGGGKKHGSSRQKSIKRLLWEYFHRLLGMILLALAWYNCHSGIQWQLANWEDQRDWTGTFWGITVSISGTVFLLAYVIRI